MTGLAVVQSDAGEEDVEWTVAQDRAMDMLGSDAMYCALGGGSRSGKTFLLVMAVIMRAIRAPGSRHVIFRFRFNSVKAFIILDTLPKVLKLCFPGLPRLSQMINKTDWYCTLPNGSEIWFGGLDDKERVEKILGAEYATIYFNECSQIPWGSVVMAMTRLAQKAFTIDLDTGEADGGVLPLKAYHDFNPPSKKHWTYRRFVEKKDPLTGQLDPKPYKFGFYYINPKDNIINLSPEYIEMLEGLPEKARNRFLHGRFGDDTDGALWTEELLYQNRVLGQEGTLPQWLRIVVAVDPSGCSGPEDYRSDEIGITVSALGTDNHGYLLEDLSGRYSPEEWGQIAVEAYRRHAADRIVGEKNYGGDMVRAIIHAVDADIPYKEVNATRGKQVRAEPIAALYEQKKFHHIGHFLALEEQLCGMTMAGYVGIKSPDRADSLIWGATELFPGITEKAEALWLPPQTIKPSRSASRFDRRKRL